MSMYTLPRQVLPPTLTTGSDKVNLSPQYTTQNQISRTPKTPAPPQIPTLVLGSLDYTKGTIECTIPRKMRGAI